MKPSILFLVTLLGMVNVGRASESPTCSMGAGHGSYAPCLCEGPCTATLELNFDGTVEDAYCWQYGGIAGPYYGAFAESYSATGTVCGIDLWLTGRGNEGVDLDAYVWDDSGGAPGNVLAMTHCPAPSPIGMWPIFSEYVLAVSPVTVAGSIWIGYWADYSLTPCGYYLAADLDGFGGTPMTNVAPGIGYPTGWQSVSAVWGPTKALGIGVWITDAPAGACCVSEGSCVMALLHDCRGRWLGPDTSCDPNPCTLPAKKDSWGRIKAGYQ